MKNIEENNRIIAVFMGVAVNEEKCSNCRGYGHTDSDGYSKCTCCKGKGRENPVPEYDESWDWQIPVFHTICTKCWDEKEWCYFKTQDFKGYTKGSDEYIEFIESYNLALMRNAPGEACEILVKFIKWYNKIKQLSS